MRNVYRISIPIILAFLLTGMLIYFAEASSFPTAAPSQSTPEGTILVTTLEDELNTDGDCSLREAITAANDNTAVDACPAGGAVITDTITFNIVGIITVTSQLIITDGGPLVIDGGDAINTSGGGSTRVWWVDQGSVFTLRHLNVLNGRLGFGDDGAGLYNNRGKVIIDHCLFTGNTFGGSINYGGGIFNWYGNLTVLDSEFTGNGGDYSETYGGGIAVWGGTANISRTTFRQNLAHGDHFGPYESYAGGGMSVFQSTVTIQDSSFIGNEGHYWGGGIAQQGQSILNITDTTFISNTTSTEGGGIYVGPDNFPVTGTITITNSTFSGNDAYSGAGIDIEQGTGVISNSTFSHNYSLYGAGVTNSRPLTIINSTFSRNTVEYEGGGIHNTGNLTIINSTVADNNSEMVGALSSGYGIVTIHNSIIANNLPGGDCHGNIIDGGHNLDSDGTCGLDPASGSLPNTDPLLGPLQDNGGPSLTHALLDGSPGIDAGDNAQCPSTDQRNFPRPIDGDGDGIAVCDIGSYELEGPWVSPTLVTITGPSEGFVGQSYLFIATVEPISTSLPLTYIWRVDGQVPITQTGGLTDTISFVWEMTGTQLITVTASNPAGAVTDTHLTMISPPIYNTYLPLVIKSSSPPPGQMRASHLPEGAAFVGLVFIGVMGWWKKRS